MFIYKNDSVIMPEIKKMIFIQTNAQYVEILNPDGS